MSTLISSNMSLPVPGVGTETGPDYAQDVNSCFTLIDAHDHSPGQGVQITPAGININATLSFNSQQATTLLSASFTAQNSPSSVLQSIYVAPGTESPTPIQDLWYTDSAGNNVQLTSNGLVNAIVASLPGESYSGGTFFWKQGTGSTTPANFDIGSIVLRPNTAATTNGVTLSPPAGIASAFTITLPADPAAAGGSNFLLMDTSGVVSGGALVDNASLQFTSHVLSVKAGGITSAMIAAGTLQTAHITNVTATGTFVVPTGVTYVNVLCLGGGGGGSGGQTGGGFDGGGGGGAVTPVFATLAVTPGETLTVNVGAGGLAGGINADGGAGGTSSVLRSTARLVFCSGGAAGTLAAGGAAAAFGAFGNQVGRAGSPGTGGAAGLTGVNSPYATGGAGGGASAGPTRSGGSGGSGGYNGNGGAGGDVITAPVAGAANTGAGGGGGAGGASAPQGAGAAGGTGLVRFTWVGA